ncbi:uncharacterized protein B0J16DRAFT_372051 [Fusarium flagelliforme]|uniref:uncharacterized protein n=1 Tax=Fusarium flagelliforme TaxID=2675880 RepID=UPI001E8D0261|nr:uncharacterized protein B0J16DRAFT_372051 [Fusarium flagelliforme]KAH7185224.1 hypothetical protein B0J16DRAFT_372051 [Fusarium flagelliforme]
MSSSPESKAFDSKAKEAEYQALWQVCDRATRKGDYIYASKETKRIILHNVCGARVEKRRSQGKAMCGTSIAAMVDLHLQRETNARLRAGLDMPQGPSFVANPNGAPFFAGHQGMNAAPHMPVPQHHHQPHVSIGPPGLDHVIRDMKAQLDSQANFIDELVDALRDHHGRIARLERREAATPAQPAQPAQPLLLSQPLHSPVECLEGGAFAFPLARPMTPESKIVVGDGDDHQEGGVYVDEA